MKISQRILLLLIAFFASYFIIVLTFLRSPNRPFST